MTFARINGISIAYRDAGSGTPIVFIHGHPFNQSMWDTQIAALTWKYRVITFDLRGYGESEVPATEAITLETMAADINALLDHLHIPKAVAAGLSMGGQIAMAFADQFPHRLSGLILAATFPQADTEDTVKLRRATADRFLNEGSAIPGGEMIPKLLAPSSIRKNPDIAVAVYTMIAHTSPAGAAAALRGRALRKDYTASLGMITVPTLIVVGTKDSYVSVETAREMQQAIPNSRLEVFDGIGHLPNLEATDHFNAVLQDYLAGISNAPPPPEQA